MSLFSKLRSGEGHDEELGGQMSFLDHLDELRSRIIRSLLFVVIAVFGCWFVKNEIYNFLAAPVQLALAEAQRLEVPIAGFEGNETIQTLGSLKENGTGRFVFAETTKLGTVVIPPGASVQAVVKKDKQGKLGLFTDEMLFAGNAVVPKGVRLPIELDARPADVRSSDDRLIVTTAIESFSLYFKVSLYAAVCLSIPFLLWQVWAFISPGLYPHERGYAVPFVVLSSILFVCGAFFAYYVIFPPAVRYLLGLGEDFRLLLKADDYFDFIIIVMLAMGIIFQMPAITFVLSRIGLVSARFLLRIWKTSVVVIMVVAAVASPTNDIPNMMLFAAPMLVLYMISVFVAWIFGKERRKTA